MTAAALQIVPNAASGAARALAEPVRLHRRRQRVIVRAGTASPAPVDADRRAHTLTLPGLGADQRIDTLPDWDVEEIVELTPTPVSQVRPVLGRAVQLPAVRQPAVRQPAAGALALGHPRLPPPAARAPERPRGRPETLLDDVDDERAQSYLEEARRILESGFFERDHGT